MGLWLLISFFWYVTIAAKTIYIHFVHIVLQALVQKGADVSMKDEGHDTAIDFAEDKYHSEIVDILEAAAAAATGDRN